MDSPAHPYTNAPLDARLAARDAVFPGMAGVRGTVPIGIASKRNDGHGPSLVPGS